MQTRGRGERETRRREIQKNANAFHHGLHEFIPNIDEAKPIINHLLIRLAPFENGDAIGR